MKTKAVAPSRISFPLIRSERERERILTSARSLSLAAMAAPAEPNVRCRPSTDNRRRDAVKKNAEYAQTIEIREKYLETILSMKKKSFNNIIIIIIIIIQHSIHFRPRISN